MECICRQPNRVNSHSCSHCSCESFRVNLSNCVPPHTHLYARSSCTLHSKRGQTFHQSCMNRSPAKLAEESSTRTARLTFEASYGSAPSACNATRFPLTTKISRPTICPPNCCRNTLRSSTPCRGRRRFRPSSFTSSTLALTTTTSRL